MSILVDGPASLSAALKSARPGDTILLEAGTYSSLVLPSKDYGGITIASADKNNQAEILKMELNGVSGVKFENLEFNIKGRIFVTSSKNVEFSGVEIHGGLDTDLSNEPPGIELRSSTDIVIENSELHHLASGIGHSNSERILIKDNVFHDVRMDAIRGGGTSSMTIEGNYFTDARRYGGEHNDLIQFWTTNTTTPTRDITVRDNVFLVGSGTRTQGIFLGNENKIPYENILITGNFLAGTSYHALSVFHAKNAVIQDNVVLGTKGQNSWIYNENVNGLTLTGNTANEYKGGGNVILEKSNNATAPAVTDGGVAAYARFTEGEAEKVLLTSGADTAVGTVQKDSINGGSGSDRISGDAGVDDLRGGVGADTISGGFGDDWVFGDDGNDLLFGDGGQDVVHGNAGNDTCYGGGGADTLRGGQGDDVIQGGAGNDLVFGDMGSDTLTGGSGADTFFSFSGADRDLITDFSRTEGDIIRLEAGSTWSAVQRAADVVVSIGGGAELTLANANLASLTTGWIVAG